jgi:co-chaperonin GroES (HSP10)
MRGRMSNISAHHNIAMLHELDPREKLLAEIGDLSKFEIFNTGVLVAVYIRPEKTKGGFILTDKTRDEDRYQSKVGLVVKTGPRAFVEDDGKWFDGLNIGVGDWLVFRPSDGWNITVHGVLCRFFSDDSFKWRIPHPDEVY